MEKTNLNVNPYYDDFDEDKNFHRVLFRPGFAVQARELTQLQTIIQNQVERHGRHIFKEGTVVIPGSIGFTNEFYAVKLQSTISGVDISDQLDDYVGTRITGVNTGVVAEVITVTQATAADPITLFVKYIRTGTDNETTVFADGEEITSDAIVGDFGAGISSAVTLASNATAVGSSANIQEGVYFVRGHFIKVDEQRIILDKYSDAPSYRIGLTVAESLVTPEDDTSLQDNAQGTSNENAKGAHRLKFTLTLAKKALTATDDTDFVELIRVKNGVLQEVARNTEYSVLEETLARRTFDLQGDITIRDFDVDIRETLNDGENNGLYAPTQTTDDGNTPSDDLLTVQISPGKAYVRGYEIDVIAPRFVDVEKPRTFEYVNGAVTPVEVGNFALVNNAYNIPDLSPEISGEVAEPYRTIELYDTQTASRGSASGTRIGLARARAIEHVSGNSGTGDDFLADSSTTDSEFRLYLFDLRLFTKVVLSGTPDPAVATGTKVTGATSGATGFVTSDSSGSNLFLSSVVGTFTVGENIVSTSSTEADELLQDSGSTDLTVSSVDAFAFENAKQVFMNDPDAGQDFTADLKLENTSTLEGLVTIDGADKDAVIGSNTSFSSQLRVGDIIQVPSGSNGALEERVVDAVTSDNVLDLGSDVTNGITSTNIIRIRAKLNDQNRNILLRKLQKQTIKTLKADTNSGVSDTSVVIRRQFVATSNSSGEIALTAGTNETFNAESNTDYVVSILSAGTGSGAAGDIVNVNSSNVSIAGTGTGTLTITSNTVFGNGAKVKVVATLTRTVVSEKTKTNNRGHLVLVDNDGVGGGAEYGTSAHHKDVSLGVADVHRLLAVYDSGDTSTDPALPQWTATSFVGAFTKGEAITGGTSNATGIIVNTTSPITYVLTSAGDFQSGETITGAESGATVTLNELTEGSTVVTNNFTLDTGQRDNYYDISRLVRKSSATSPSGRLLVVCDFFSHGTGDFFSVDSYSSIDYKDIPTYTATRVDPEVREPTGEYDLRDTVDFRPRVANVTTTTSTIQGQTVNKVTGFSFNFESRSFSGTGSSTVDIPKDNSNFQYDFDFYLGRIDLLYLTSEGQFKIVSGAPAENPSAPKALDNAMLIAKLELPAYAISLADVGFAKESNRKFTMKDIGNLESRINNIEYYTALNLLEKDAQSLQIQDANGLDRFKSGFVVDNFRGHATGDVKHPDYRAAIDMQNGNLRPKYYMKGITLSEENTTDTERTNNNYRKTGDVLTLPYEDIVAVDQPYATRVENLNPVLSFSWAGICKLTPSADEWFEVDRLPDLIINREGNFDTVLAENRNALGTVWNAWQTQWSGVTSTSSTRFRDQSFTSAASRSVRGRAVVERTVTTERGVSTRQGIQTSVVAQIDRESQGERILSRALIPFIRSRNVSFDVTGMKPLTKVYAFFDKQNVGQYVTPTGGSLGGDLITSASGSVSGVFQIPDPNVRGNPRFRTGDRVFRLTSDQNNGTESVESFAQSTYSATGILNTVQETIIATRNARVEVRDVSQSRNVTRSDTRDAVVGWWDPLAQSFMPQAEGGEYITKIDAFFSQKDTDIPVTCQIREMQNGYPTTNVLPFGSKTLQPSEVSVSDDASLATTFTFDSPVYVKNGVEYCIVLFTDSQNYFAWISRMGEVDVTENRLVSEQPYLGVLFKSQNNTTWTAYDFEDLKFVLYRAEFDTSVSGAVTLTNDELPVRSLEQNPIQTFNGSNVVKVLHRDHHMHDTDNNVVITGVSSGTSTTLDGAISAGDSSLTLTSSTGFPSSGTVTLKIEDEVVSGTISGTTVSSLTRGVEGSDVDHADDVTVELYQIASIPLTEINKTHTSITASGLDYYTLTLSTNATQDGVFGGSSITATENAQMDQFQTLLPVIEHPDTAIRASVITTSGTSPSGSEQSFSLAAATSAETVPLTDNYEFRTPRLVCSQINETNELAGQKSFKLNLNLTSSVSNLSPIIDLDRKSIVTVANRLDNIDDSSDVFPTSSFVSPTDPEGDSNEVVYITRKVQLANPANSLKVYLDAVRPATSEIQVMYKILRSDDASDFDELGFVYFNTDGSPDTNVNPSTTNEDFVEYEFTEDDIGEFIAFAIKIRMQGTNSSQPPLVKDLRAIALAT